MRKNFKHGKRVRAAVPHADIDKIIDKGTGKEDDRKGNRSRVEGSELKISKSKKGRGPSRREAGRAGYRGGGRTNLLEELGRVEAEPSNRNRRAEVSRIHGELNRGYARGGKVSSTKKKPYHDKTTLAKSERHPHSRLKTQKEYRAITDSAAYKKADYRTQNKMLAEHPKYKRGGRIGLSHGGSAGAAIRGRGAEIK